MPKVLIIVENLPVPLDRRVWQEAQALTAAGFTVSVICPKAAAHTESYEYLNSIHIFRHSLPFEARGILGFFLEYAWAWICELFLAFRVRRRIGFDVIQACNPPDNIFLIALVFKWLFGTKFVFDHHDPFTDLFAVKFPRKDWLLWLPRLAERFSLRCADHVITTSQALLSLAIQGHGIPADKITLVRSGIDPAKARRVTVPHDLKNGRRYLALYVGVMGAQDGVDILLDAAAHIIHDRGRTDITFAILGDGPELEHLKSHARLRAVDDYVVFTGYLQGDDFLAYMSAADIGTCPDPKNRFNDKLSMNKVLEYMTFGIPVVQFDLDEGRHIAGDASAYAQDNSAISFAQNIVDLLDDENRRRDMGAAGKARIANGLSWDVQKIKYVDMYKNLLGISG